MRKNLFSVVLLLLLSLNASAKDYLLTEYQAVDTTGQQMASPAINALIDRCSSEGGGRVVVPQGRYLCGTIFMKSGVELHLQRGAQIIASPRNEDFPIQPRNHCRSQKDTEGWNALVYAADCHDLGITGEGTIDGRGGDKHGYLKKGPYDGNGRPRNILFVSCRKVMIKGITVKNSPVWNQHYFNCEDVTIDRIHSWNHCNANNDGIDIDGCRRVKITRCVVDSDDDGIVLKSTGLALCEDILISHCTVSTYANAIKCGTETVGGFKRVKVKHCKVRPSSHTGNMGHRTKRINVDETKRERKV
jgi:polygalacturonase